MLRMKFAAGATITLLLLCGCGRDAGTGEPGWIVGAPEKKLEEMSARDVIVSVDGAELTKERYERMLANSEKAFRRGNPSVQDGRLKAFLKERQGALIREFISRHIYLSEARRRGLKVAPERIRRYENIYRDQAKEEGQTLDEFIASMGDTKREFSQRIEEQALIEALLEDEFGNSLELTEEDVAKKKASNERYNAICEATNRLVTARGEMIVGKLREGADFLELAKQFSESDEDEEGLWGDFTRQEIEDANVRHAAFTLPVGAVSEPFDTDVGLVIIKVLERTGVDAVGAEEEASVKLGRILLRMGELRIMPDEQRFRRELAASKRSVLLQRFVTELKPRSRVEFPHGANLWEQTEGRSFADGLQ